jgi:hypothetical protein
MPYTRTPDWQNGPSGGTPLIAENLDAMQDALANHATQSAARTLNGGRLVAYNTSRSAGRVPDLTNGGPWDTADRFPDKLAALLNMYPVMLATAGATVSWDETDAAAEAGGGWVTILHDDRRRRPYATQNYGYASPTALWTSADWVNDIPRVNDGTTNGSGTRQNARTTAILKHAQRFVYSRACAAVEWRPDDTAGSAPVTYSTSPASTAVAVSYSTVWERAYRGAVSGPGGYRSMPANSWLELPLQADYPGSALAPLVVCFGGVNAVTTGQISVSGAGASGNAKTLDLIGANVADPTHINPLVLRLVGNDVPAGASTVRFTVSANLAGANARFLGAWIESPDPPPGIAFNTAKMNGNLYFTWATDADYNYQNARQAETVAEFTRAGKPDHVLLGDIDAVIGGTRAGDASKAKYFTDTMHGEALTAGKYVEVAAQKLGIDLTTTPDLSAVMLRGRAPVADMVFEGGLSANWNVPNNGGTLPIDVERRDHSGMRASTSNTTRVYLPSTGVWLAMFETGWRNSQGNLSLTGTVAKTAASSVVTGTGTAFTTQLAVGQLIRVPGTANEDRIIQRIASDTSLTVGAPFDNSASGQTALRLSPTGSRGIGYKVTREDASVVARTTTMQPQDSRYNSIFPLLQAFNAEVVTRTPGDYLEFTAFHDAGTGLTDSLDAASTRVVVQRLRGG